MHICARACGSRCWLCVNLKTESSQRYNGDFGEIECFGRAGESTRARDVKENSKQRELQGGRPGGVLIARTFRSLQTINNKYDTSKRACINQVQALHC